MKVSQGFGTSLKVVAAAALAASAALASPALADVKDGVDAWSRGDYVTAVAQWQGPVARGDADAQFNMAQAYRLGRGVSADKGRAEDLYRKAAAQGHVEAADTYGLMLFQDGRREQALPYVEAAAGRGDPRAQYLLGIAHFNGDMVQSDWVRAYALLTLANGAGLPQASNAIAEMDKHIPLEQRQQAAGLAMQLRQQADAERSRQLAAADLSYGTALATKAPPRSAPVAAAAPASALTPTRPTVSAATAAVAEAARATGNESPAMAGADYAGVAAPVTRPTPPVVEVAAVTALAPRPAREASGGPWKIQLGAFGVAGNAEKLWSRLSDRSELAGRQRLLVPVGRVTKLLAGGYASREQADTACAALKRSGQDCLVTR